MLQVSSLSGVAASRPFDAAQAMPAAPPEAAQAQDFARMLQQAASPGFDRAASPVTAASPVERKVKTYAHSVDQGLAASHKDLQALLRSPQALADPMAAHAQMIDLFQRQSGLMMQLALTTGAAQGFSNVLSSLLKNSS